ADVAAAAMPVSNTSSTSSTSELHASTKAELKEALEQQCLEKSTMNQM
ncbi:unnamed protein product, partial [Adineta steineri]